MKQLCLASLLLFIAAGVQAQDAPSAVMRQVPSIPDPVTAQDCDAMEPVLATVEQSARAEMLRAQQLAMRGAQGGAVSNRQGDLVARLMDPALMQCEMQVTQAAAGEDVTAEFIIALDGIHTETRNAINTSCPVIGMADYRDEACVDPILQRGMQKERAAIATYVASANDVLERDVNGYAQCAERRERLADEVESAGLPVQYVSMALNGRALGWQQVAALAERYGALCRPAATAMADLDSRKRR